MKSLFESWRRFVNEGENVACGCVDSSQTNLTIEDVQNFLHNNGHPLRETFKTGKADGKCGPETRQAIIDFQRDKGLEQDACVGTQTASAIEAGQAGKKPKTTAVVKVTKKQESSIVSGKIAAVGDSLTVGAAAGNKSYIDILGGKKFAIGGKASFQLLGQAERAIASNPEYLVVYMGINDAHFPAGCGDKLSDKVISNLSKIYSAAKQKGIKIIGIKIHYPQRYWSNHYRKCKKDPSKKGCCKNNENRSPANLWKHMQLVNQWIQQNANFAIETNDLWIDGNKADDDIHWNSAGQNEIAKRIPGAINQ